MKTKEFLKNPWTLSIGSGLIVLLISSIINSIINKLNLFEGLYNILTSIVLFFKKILTYKVSIWVVILIFLALFFILIFISIIRDKFDNPKWKEYKLQYFGKWLFTWKYIDMFGNTEIISLRPICDNCRCDLSAQLDSYQMGAIKLYCPNCGKEFPVLKNTTLEDVEKIIIRNLKTGEYQLKNEQ
jgi:hypothetical protein